MVERQYPRFAADLSVTVTPRGGTAFVGTTRDISAGGICLIADADNYQRVGALLSLSLQLVFGPDTASEPLELTMKIIWCTPSDGQLQMGGKFIELQPEQNEYLAMFLRFLGGEL